MVDRKLWRENGKENFFWSVIGWVERKENKCWGLGVFSPGPPKSFLPKMKRKMKGENEAA